MSLLSSYLSSLSKYDFFCLVPFGVRPALPPFSSFFQLSSPYQVIANFHKFCFLLWSHILALSSPNVSLLVPLFHSESQQSPQLLPPPAFLHFTSPEPLFPALLLKFISNYQLFLVSGLGSAQHKNIRLQQATVLRCLRVYQASIFTPHSQEKYTQ